MKKPQTVDPIVKEVRQVRQRLSGKFGHDIRAIAADIRVRQRSNPRLVRASPSKRAV